MVMKHWLWVIVPMLYLLLKCFYKRKNLPPGPLCWPLVGCIFSLKQPWHQHFARLAGIHGPVIYVKVGMLPMVVVNNSEMAKEVLKTHDLEFAFRPPTKFFETYSQGFKGIICAPHGEYWKAMRKVAFVNSAKLNATASSRDFDVRSLVSTIRRSCPEGLVDLRNVLGDINSSFVFKLLFGIVPMDSAKVLKLTEIVANSALNANIGEIFPAIDWLDLHGIYKRMKMVLLPEFKSMILEILKQRNGLLQSQDQDAIDVLQSLGKEETSTEASIMAFVMDMLSASTETATATEWALAEVMNNPRIMQKAQSEIDSVVGPDRLVKDSDVTKLPYVQAITKEALRLHPPVPLGVPHCNPKETTISGYVIPSKCQVMINIWAIGRDPARWNDPLRFMPERFLAADVNVTGQHFDLLPFSAGRRMCPGYLLALRSMPFIIATLIHAFNWERHGKNCLEEAPGTLSSRLTSKLDAYAHPRLNESAYYLTE